MCPISRAILTMAILAATSAESAHEPSNAVYLATYVDVMPNAVAFGAQLFEQYGEASRTQSGNQRIKVLQEIARPNRFAILEVWTNAAALNGHEKAASTLHAREQLKTIQNAPYDERVGRGLYIGRGKGKSGPGAIYVLTHVDVAPDHRDDCLRLLNTMSIDTANEDGNISYEVLQQTNRLNHFTVMEEWTNRKAVDAHAMAAHTRAFRQQLLPMEGALYDERFYKKAGLND
jgi:quinol monooxygenase YgiN